MIIDKQHIDDGLLKLSINGDLDASSALVMDSVIKQAYQEEHFRILVDCKSLNYISSAGLGVFISYHEDFLKEEGKFVFFEMSDKVYNVFELLGLHDLFKIVKSEHEAKNLFKDEN